MKMKTQVIVMGTLCLIASVSAFLSNAQIKKKNKSRSGAYVTVNILDSNIYPIKIKTYSRFLLEEMPDKTESTPHKISNGYRFFIDGIKTAMHFTLYKIGNPHAINILQLYPITAGDNIIISIKNDGVNKNGIPQYKIQFRGHGYEKFECRYRIDTSVQALPALNKYSPISKSGQFLLNDYYDRSHAVSDSILKLYKKKIKLKEMEILQTDVWASMELERLSTILRLQRELLDDSLISKTIIYNYRRKINSFGTCISDTTKLLSAKYSELLIKTSLIQQYSGISGLKKDHAADKILEELYSKYTGEFRDKIMTMGALHLATLSYRPYWDGLFYCVNVIERNYYQQLVTDFINTNAKGKPAFQFELPDLEGKTVRLSDFKGKVVFIDFWYKGCPGCYQYFTNIISKAEKYFKDEKDVVFISININTEKKDWIEAVNSGFYTTKEIINLYTEGEGTDHPIIKQYMVTSYPQPILIDRNGNIYTRDRRDLRDGNKTETLIRTIKQALSEN